jgi:hypothetical protein
MDSPVMLASSMPPRPATITPSAGTRAPGRSTTTSPTASSPRRDLLDTPSAVLRSAVSGRSAISASTARRARPSARSSSVVETLNSVSSTAPSNGAPTPRRRPRPRPSGGRCRAHAARATAPDSAAPPGKSAGGQVPPWPDRQQRHQRIPVSQQGDRQRQGRARREGHRRCQRRLDRPRHYVARQAEFVPCMGFEGVLHHHLFGNLAGKIR